MNKFFPYALAIAMILGLGALGVAPVSTVAQDQVYGSQLMTQQERLEYSARMRAARTDAERQAIRNEHHVQMQARAKEMGVTLPDEPPAFGQGMGQGQGMGGQGMGGQGMGGQGMGGQGMGGQGMGGGGRN